jgi:hypothetical protein
MDQAGDVRHEENAAWRYRKNAGPRPKESAE